MKFPEKHANSLEYFTTHVVYRSFLNSCIKSYAVSEPGENHYSQLFQSKKHVEQGYILAILLQ